MDITARIRISYPHSNTSDAPIVRLTLIDDASTELIFEANIPAADFAMSLGSTGIHVGGMTTPRPERFGRRVAVDARYLGRGTTPEQQEAAKAEALASGWESAEIRRTNRGPELVMRAWPANEEG